MPSLYDCSGARSSGIATGSQPTPVMLVSSPIAPSIESTDLETQWGATQPYDLRELAESIPAGWKEPEKPLSGLGRNAGLFLSLVKWAGSPSNIQLPILPIAERLNRDFDFPPACSRGVSASPIQWSAIEGSWLEAGRFYDEEQVKDWHRRGQAASVKVRQRKNAERDGRIRAARLLGFGVRQTSGILGEARSTVSRVRGADPAPEATSPV